VQAWSFESSIDDESQYQLAPWGCGVSFRRLPNHRLDNNLDWGFRYFRIDQETACAIELFRRTSLARINMSVEGLTFA
jgi:hypothetical protein